MTLNVQSARYFFNDGYPTLEIVVNGKSVWLDRHNRNSLSDEGYISLGAEFQSAVPEIRLPAKPEQGRSPMTLEGFTTNPLIQTLFKGYIADVENKTFVPRKLSLAQAN